MNFMDHFLVIKLFNDGGITMYPLLLCSILAFAAIIERALSLRPNKILCIDQLIEVEELLKNGRLEEAYHQVKDSDAPMLRIVKISLLHSGRAKNELKESIENAGRLELPELQKNLAMLNTLAVISPLIGMLGTVLGMIQVFSAVMNETGINMTILAQGISQALLTSAVGLVIAVPCLIFYNYFFRKIENLTNEMEKYSLTLMNLLIRAVEKNEDEDN